MSFKYNTSFLELIDSIDWSKSGITPSDLVDYIESLLEQQNAKNVIEITARCKETTEALIKETEQRVAKEILSGIEVRHRLIKGHFLSVDEYDYIKQKYIKESK
jgi:hypothetical protein